MKTHKTEITVDELVSTIKHSSLPTLIVEGVDDVIVFRRLEDSYSSIQLSILPAGGRTNLLKLFERLAELPKGKIAFIADRDTWVYSGIPAEYDSNLLAFTAGYSIENDIYLDGTIEAMMTPAEKIRFKTELIVFVEWYALAADRFIRGLDQKLDLHPNYVLKGIDPEEFTGLEVGETYPAALRDSILANYKLLLRGKSLLNLAIRQLSYTGRPVRHQTSSLMETVASRPGQHLSTLYSHVGNVFSTMLLQRSS